MFPLKANEPYIKETGERSTLGAELAAGGGGYVLPVASAETLGGVKVGDGLSITEAGVLSATGGSGGGGLKVYTVEVSNSHSAVTDEYLGGNSLSTWGMSEGDTLIGLFPADGHFSKVYAKSTSGGSAGTKAYKDMTPSDTLFVYGDIKYQTSSSSPGYFNILYLTS